MNKEIRILLVDDHQVVREGLWNMLSQEEDMEVVGQGANSEEALSQTEILSPNIILMDIKMPGVDGIELTRRLKERQPYCNVIMLTLYDEYLADAIDAGAVGYLLKDAKRAELTEAIRQVHRGEMAISDSIRAKSGSDYKEIIANKMIENPSKEYDELSPEEIQMIIPPPTEASQLIKLVDRVEDILQARVLQMVGSWKGDTAITIALSQATPVADILDKLRRCPEIDTIEEKLSPGKANPSLFKKVTTIPRVKATVRKTIFVTLKRSDTGDQTPQNERTQVIDVKF